MVEDDVVVGSSGRGIDYAPPVIPTELAPLPQQHAIPVKPAQTLPPSTLPTSCLQDSLGD